MLSEVLEQMDLRPAGSPFGEGLVLGDYGEIHKGRFRWCGNIRSLIDISDEEWTANVVVRAYAARLKKSGGVVWSATEGSGGGGGPQARVSVSFGKKGGCILHTGDSGQLLQIGSDFLANRIGKARQAPGCGFTWFQRYHVIWKLVTSSDALYLEARGSGIQVHLEAKMQVLESGDFGAAHFRAAALRHSNDVFFCEQRGRGGAVGIQTFSVGRFREVFLRDFGDPLAPVHQLAPWEPPLGSKTEISFGWTEADGIDL